MGENREIGKSGNGEIEKIKKSRNRENGDGELEKMGK